MPIDFLIVGLATDGPSNTAYRPRDLRDLKSMFGGTFKERFYLTASSSSLTMQFFPYLTPLNKVNGTKQYLFSPYLDNTSKNIMYFGTIGGSGTQIVDLDYMPYLGKSDLLIAAERYFVETGEMPWILRLGGETASLSVSGWSFEAKYAGGKYNYLGLNITASAMTVFGMEPSYLNQLYNFTTVEDLALDIKRRYELGTSPIVCTVPATAFPPTGVFWFSGGSDGSFSDSDVESWLTRDTLPIQTSHVLLLKEISSGMIEQIANSFANKEQLRLFFIPALSYFGTGSASWYIDNAAYYLPYRHNMIASVIGNINLTHNNRRISRYAAEAAAIAYKKSGAYNITNLPVTAESFEPVLTEDNLNLLKAAGFMTLMRYIGNDISVYEGVTTYAENSFLFNSKVAEISAIAHDYCFQFFGISLPNGDRPEMEMALSQRLSGVKYVEIQHVRITKRGEELFVRIEGFLPSEILSISFTIQNK